VRQRWLRTLLGCALLLLGGLVLLERLGILTFGPDAVQASLLILGGLLCFLLFFSGAWWAAIASSAVMAAAAISLLPDESAGDLEGSIFLAAAGLSFLAVYMRRREHWWPLIPAGVLITLAVAAGVRGAPGDPNVGGLVILGLAATFLSVAALGRAPWAYYPAGALALAALLLLALNLQIADYIFGGLLAATGAYLIARYARRR